MTQEQVIVNQRRSLMVFAQRQSVLKACQTFGVSRTTFYKIRNQLLKTGSLAPRVRSKPRMPNETRISKKKILLNLVKEHPGWGLDRFSYALRQQGIEFQRRAVHRCLQRFDLNKRLKRLVYVETLKSKDQPLTEQTLQTLKKKFKKVKDGRWPGHVVALDTFYVGHLKGVGRIYQFSGIDLYSRFGWAHLYTSKEIKGSVHFLENILIPKFFGNNVSISSILTDNGTEFTGKAFQNLLQDYEFKHHRIPKGKPIYNGYCERFQRTILEEFYQPMFRKQFFRTLNELQEALNKFSVYYNFERPHFGLNPKGAIPIDVLKSKDKILRHRFNHLST